MAKMAILNLSSDLKQNIKTIYRFYVMHRQSWQGIEYDVLCSLPEIKSPELERSASETTVKVLHISHLMLTWCVITRNSWPSTFSLNFNCSLEQRKILIFWILKEKLAILNLSSDIKTLYCFWVSARQSWQVISTSNMLLTIPWYYNFLVHDLVHRKRMLLAFHF